MTDFLSEIALDELSEVLRVHLEYLAVGLDGRTPRGNPEPRIEHVDCEVDYQCQCQPEYTYTAVGSPDNEVLSEEMDQYFDAAIRLSKLPQNEFLYCRDLHNHFAGFQPQRHCRFLAEIDLTQDSTEAISIRNSLRNLGVNDLGDWTSILVENSVRVSFEDRRPLARTSQSVRPVVAFRAGDANVVLFREEYREPNRRCGVTKAFDQPIFGVAHCGNETGCVETILTEFQRQLDKHIIDGPLRARVDQRDQQLPGERMYYRENQRSEVLGPPYFEHSQYLLRWYRANQGNVIVSSFAMGSGNAANEGDFLHLRIQHSLSVRAGQAGPYPEAEDAEYAAYSRAVADVIRDARSATCAELLTTFSDERACDY